MCVCVCVCVCERERERERERETSPLVDLAEPLISKLLPIFLSVSICVDVPSNRKCIEFTNAEGSYILNTTSIAFILISCQGTGSSGSLAMKNFFAR